MKLPIDSGALRRRAQAEGAEPFFLPMGNALARHGGSNYRWDALFQALTRPVDLRRYLESMIQQEEGAQHGPLRTQIELLTGTLQVDLSLLKVAEVAESFDTATFCLGQLVSHEPQMISELSFAYTFIDGLAAALRKGWLVHHGVGKFAANALTILCICEQARTGVRERAIDELMAGLLEWLRSEDTPEDLDEVCGCNCGSPALSATCWLEVRAGVCFASVPHGRRRGRRRVRAWV